MCVPVVVCVAAPSMCLCVACVCVYVCARLHVSAWAGVRGFLCVWAVCCVPVGVLRVFLSFVFACVCLPFFACLFTCLPGVAMAGLQMPLGGAVFVWHAISKASLSSVMSFLSDLLGQSLDA